MRSAADAVWTDERFERLLGRVLQTGVLLAACTVSIGAIVYLARHGATHPSYHVFKGEPGDLRSVTGILGDLRHLSGRALIQFGILMLVATPVVRVLLSTVVFALERDRRYVVFTLTVLLILFYSLFAGQL